MLGKKNDHLRYFKKLSVTKITACEGRYSYLHYFQCEFVNVNVNLPAY